MSSILSYIPKFIETSPLLPSVQNTISNRVNNMGDALELYIRETIAGVIEEKDERKKAEALSQEFSWLGNTNNIPDAILKNGDAIEIKKVESISSNLALNSSHPKDRLYSDDVRIKKVLFLVKIQLGHIKIYIML